MDTFLAGLGKFLLGILRSWKNLKINYGSNIHSAVQVSEEQFEGEQAMKYPFGSVLRPMNLPMK